MVDSPATVKKLLDVVKKSESFFVKSDQISSAMMDKMDALQGVDSTMRSVFGINVFEEIQSSKFLSGVLNFVLNLLGFSGGVVGLERDWRRRTLDRALTAPKKAFIQASYQYYIQHKSSTENFSQKVIDDYYLQLPDEKQKQLFDLDVPLLQKTLLNNLDPKTLNPNLLAALNTKTFSGKDYLLDTKKDQNQTTAIKPELFENEELKKDLINAYLAQTLPHLSQNPSFLQKAQDANTIAFTLIAGLSVDQEHLIEGIKVSALLPQEFYQPLPATTETQQEENSSDQEQVQRIKNLTFADKISDTARAVIQSELERTTPKSPLTLEMILHSSQKYQIPIEYLMAVVKNDSSYGTQ
ncbi:MAG: hypothetical protein Q4B28_00700 [bacterium]|nr:hypothetical protein [bacterium]